MARSVKPFVKTVPAEWERLLSINEYPVERFYRDARLLRLYEGTTQVQQLIIGRELLRQAA